MQPDIPVKREKKSWHRLRPCEIEFNTLET